MSKVEHTPEAVLKYDTYRKGAKGGKLGMTKFKDEM